MIISDPRMDEPECEQDQSSSRCEDKPSSNSSTSLGPPTIHDFDILKPISRGAFGKVREAFYYPVIVIYAMVLAINCHRN